MSQEPANDLRGHRRLVCLRYHVRSQSQRRPSLAQLHTAPLLTTDYVVDETLTLLRARRHHTKARWLGERFFNSQLGAIYHLTEDDLQRAWETFRDFDDKEWSFTDCASRVVIEKFNIAQAFAFDHHFRQFGTV